MACVIANVSPSTAGGDAVGARERWARSIGRKASKQAGLGKSSSVAYTAETLLRRRDFVNRSAAGSQVSVSLTVQASLAALDDFRNWRFAKPR